jgi:hypothetical protein
MSTKPIASPPPVTAPKLWFGFVASAIAWSALGCLDILITWRACMHQEDFGIPSSRPEIRIVFVVLSLALFALTVTAGITSYGNWRQLSLQRKLLQAEAVERNEFMALLGVIISVTLGIGIVWLALPPIFLDLCWRAR